MEVQHLSFYSESSILFNAAIRSCKGKPEHVIVLRHLMKLWKLLISNVYYGMLAHKSINLLLLDSLGEVTRQTFSIVYFATFKLTPVWRFLVSEVLNQIEKRARSSSPSYVRRLVIHLNAFLVPGSPSYFIFYFWLWNYFEYTAYSECEEARRRWENGMYTLHTLFTRSSNTISSQWDDN